MTLFFKRRRCDPFAARQHVEVSLTAEATEVLENLKDRYRIEVTLPAEPFEAYLDSRQHRTTIEGQPATSEEAECFMPLFAEELGFYPRQFVQNMNLARVVLCGQLFLSQCPKPAVKLFARRTGAHRTRGSFQHGSNGGFADSKNGIVYLAIASHDFDHLRKSIHHELYHCVQWRQFGNSGDREWSALNTPDFAYGPGGSAALHGPDRTFWVLPGEEWGHGFLNRYSMSAAEEDQAEIFAHLLTRPAQMEARASVDEILQKKIERLKLTLQQFCPHMSEAFWQFVEESRLPFDL